MRHVVRYAGLMKDIRTREKVVAAVYPVLTILATAAAIGLLWPVLGWWAMLGAMLPAAVVIFAHPMYRLVVRPRRIRRFLRKKGVPADGMWKMAVRFERTVGRDFTSWENPLLALYLHDNFSGYGWAVRAYDMWKEYDLGLDWDVFFTKVWRYLLSPNFDARVKAEMVTPLVQLLAEGKVDVVELSRLVRSDLSFEGLMMVVREGLPMEYAAVL